MLEASAVICVNMSGKLLTSVHPASEERSRLEDFLAADHDNSLASEQVFGDVACEAAEQVPTTINDNLLFEHA